MIPGCILPNRHDCLTHCRMLTQHRFNLPNFNSISTKLNLTVDPSQTFNPAVSQILCQIARPVESRTRLEMDWQQIFPLLVLLSGDIPAPFRLPLYITRLARRQEPVCMFVQQVDLCVGNRLANRDTLVVQTHLTHS